jgi:gliding motility-associated-like protein
MWGVIGDSDGKIDCETCVSTLVTPQNTLAYYVKYTTPAGCIGMDTILVNVIDISAYFLATGFSPNGDGINDVVQVHGRGIDHLSFMIFDRVGEKVFETHELETGWDGRYMGVPMNSGVFVYRLEIYYCSGQNIKETGNITLLR